MCLSEHRYLPGISLKSEKNIAIKKEESPIEEQASTFSSISQFRLNILHREGINFSDVLLIRFQFAIVIYHFAQSDFY